MAELDSQSAMAFALKIVEEYQDGKVDSSKIRPVTGGSVNQVFDYDHKLVVRVAAGKRALATFKKEEWSIDQARQQKVLTPEVLLIREQDSTAAMVQPKVRGIAGIKAKDDMFREMWRQLGRYAKQFHEVSTPGYGDRFFEQNPNRESWQNWVDAQRGGLLEDENVWRGVLSRWRINRIRKRLKRLGEFEFDPVLTHANLGERNVILDEYGKVHVLDWGNAGGYPYFWDLAEVVAWNEPDHTSIRCYCEGYGMTDQQREELSEQLLLIQTWRWLSTIRWSMDGGKDWKKSPVVRLSRAKLKKSIPRW